MDEKIVPEKSEEEKKAERYHQVLEHAKKLCSGGSVPKWARESVTQQMIEKYRGFIEVGQY